MTKKYKCQLCEDTGKVPCPIFDPGSGQWQEGTGETFCECSMRDEWDDDNSDNE